MNGTAKTRCKCFLPDLQVVSQAGIMAVGFRYEVLAVLFLRKVTERRRPRCAEIRRGGRL